MSNSKELMQVEEVEMKRTESLTSNVGLYISNQQLDSISMDNASLDVTLQQTGASSMDLTEITQSILDLEETQIPRPSDYGSCSNYQQIPSSPPPSYEHALEKSRLGVAAAAATATDDGEVDEGAIGGPLEEKKGVEIMHKSYKEFYRAVAKQWGITCKMSDHCRCLDCQSMYFECEYEQNEQEKTDGGLGAGTPMFLSEVMHGSACSIL